jgi:hypothetical protein
MEREGRRTGTVKFPYVLYVALNGGMVSDESKTICKEAAGA